MPQDHDRSARLAAWALPAGALVGLCLLAILSAPASAYTFITNTTLDQSMVLDSPGSPYIVSADFHVVPGGFLLVSEGVDLQFDNGAKLVGDGGAIHGIGTQAAPVTFRPRPGGNNTVWGGIDLFNGSDLTLRWALLEDSDELITMGGIANLDARNTTALRCGTWCVRTALSSTLDLRDTSFDGGSWGLLEEGALDPRANNVTLRNFSFSGIWFEASSAGAVFSNIVVEGGIAGIVADGLRSASIGPLTVNATTGPSVSLTGGADVILHDVELSGSQVTAVTATSVTRLSIQRGSVAGTEGGLALRQSVAPSLGNLSVRAPGGVCLDLANVTNALLRNNALGPCARSITFDSNSPPNTADADTTNTVDGRPVWWVSNQASVYIGPFHNAGFVALFTVSVAILTDLHLSGAGISLFGCNDVLVERVQVDQAVAGIEVVGSRRVAVTQLVASNVTYGVRVRSNAYYPAPADLIVNHTRVDGALAAGVRVEDAPNVTVRSSFFAGPAAGIELVRVQGAFLSKLVIRGIAVGVSLNDSLGITAVDSLFENATSLGLLVANTTGRASRNAFVNNAIHASAPASPGFEFNESGGGNFWSGFTGVDANGDGYSEAPYNLTDATGVDHRPRMARLDFSPVAILRVPPVVEIGADSTFDAALSFDDFLVDTVYWELDLAGPNFTASGPFVAWGADARAMGVFQMRVSVVGSFGAVDESFFQVRVVDTKAPTFSVSISGKPEVGGNASIVLSGAADNDPAFPAGALVTWVLRGPTGIIRTGESGSNLSFPVPVDLLGTYRITVTVTDASGNFAAGLAFFEVFDTLAPEVLFLYTGEPDLGVPFALDASQTQDPTGLLLNGTDAPLWSWFDAGTPRSSRAWPAVEVVINDTGPHIVTLRVCDVLLNCVNATVSLAAADRSAPQLVVLRVIAPGHDPVEVRAGQNVVAAGKINEDIVFEAVASDAGGNITFTWDFGDGTTAVGAHVSHTFTKVGEVSVSVQMRDGAGNANVTALRLNLEGGGIFGGLVPGFEGAAAIMAAAAAACSLGVRRRLRST